MVIITVISLFTEAHHFNIIEIQGPKWEASEPLPLITMMIIKKIKLISK